MPIETEDRLTNQGIYYLCIPAGAALSRYNNLCFVRALSALSSCCGKCSSVELNSFPISILYQLSYVFGQSLSIIIFNITILNALKFSKETYFIPFTSFILRCLITSCCCENFCASYNQETIYTLQTVGQYISHE